MGAGLVCPKPMARRLESAKWTWPMCRPASIMAWASSVSSMFHVEEVRQEKGVFQLIFFNESRSLSQTVDEVGFITVSAVRIENRPPCSLGMFPGGAEGLGQPLEGLGPMDLATPISLHGTENGLVPRVDLRIRSCPV